MDSYSEEEIKKLCREDPRLAGLVALKKMHDDLALALYSKEYCEFAGKAEAHQ
jgi:hypothetical protein